MYTYTPFGNPPAEDMQSGCNAFTSDKVSAGFMADWYDEKWTEGITLDEVIPGEAS